MKDYSREEQEHAASAVFSAGIPKELSKRPQWVAWKYETRDGKPTKVLYNPKTGRKASTTDLMTWAAFEDALDAYTRSEGRYAGIGFVFCSADPYVGIDLDKCVDPETGEVEAWAKAVIERFADTAVIHKELSPSGTGIHMIIKAICKEGTRKGSVEVYGQDRFFTVTGVAT